MSDNYSVLVDLTSNHLSICRAAASRASKHPEGSEDTLIAIVFGAAAFEAYIDHIRVLCGVNYPFSGEEEAKVTALAEALASIEKCNAQWNLKLQLVSLILSGRKLDRGIQPWQDVDFMFKARNSIVHPSLTYNVQEYDPQEPSFDKITRVFLDRGLIARPAAIKGLPGSAHEHSDLVPPPFDGLFAPKVAEWCVSTVEEGIRGIINLATPVLRRKLHEVAERLIFCQSPPS